VRRQSPPVRRAADTLAGMREAKAKGARPRSSSCNVGRVHHRAESDGVIYTHAARRSGWPPRRRSPHPAGGALPDGDPPGAVRADHDPARDVPAPLRPVRVPRKIEEFLKREPEIGGRREEIQGRARLPVPGPRHIVPIASRGAEAQGDLLHPRGRVLRRGDEARPDRADRRADAGAGALRERESYEKTLSNLEEAHARRRAGDRRRDGGDDILKGSRRT